MKKKVLKIIAFLAAIVLIAVICFLIIGFVGNPVSKMLAEKNAEEYLAENYPQQGFVINDASYNYVMANYSIKAEVPGSLDKYFYIKAGSDGRIRSDTYKLDIINRMNTSDRISTAYRESVDEIRNNPNYPYPTGNLYGAIEFVFIDEISEHSYAINRAELTPDAIYNIDKLGAEAGHISVEVWDETVTTENMAKIILNIKSLLDQGGVEFYAMDCTIHHPDYSDESISVYDLMYSDIYEEGMIERLLLANEE